jgi:lactoylglutathione lyase
MSTSGDPRQPAREKRPFRVIGIQHIAIGARDKRALRELWVDLLGLVPSGNYYNEDDNVDEDLLRVGEGAHAVEVDLMQPIDPDRRPRVHEPPLNHVGLWIDDLPAAVQWLKERGVRFTPGGIRSGASGHQICFIHPRGSEDAPIGGQGVLIELVQAPAELLEHADG